MERDLEDMILINEYVILFGRCEEWSPCHMVDSDSCATDIMRTLHSCDFSIRRALQSYELWTLLVLYRIAKTLGSRSIWHWPHIFVSSHCLIHVDPSDFVIWIIVISMVRWRPLWPICFRINWPISQIPECICAISHDATFRNRNVHMCAHFCNKMAHYGIFVWCIMEMGIFTSTVAMWINKAHERL